MKQVPDRKKLRREYVGKKAEAYTSGLLCSLFFAITFSVTLVCLYVVAMTFVPMLHCDPKGAACVGGIVSATAAGFSALHFWRGIKNAKARAKTSYIPPAKPDTLPADEILVRGAQPPPVVQSEMLLRAAQGTSTPQEELLRITDHAG